AAFTTLSLSETTDHTYPLSRFFILNSGATYYITNNLDRIYNYRPLLSGNYIWASSIRI
ncbi:hypothetical protein PTT_14751, partial [Pyrenophora teres f. teres 0-1]